MEPTVPVPITPIAGFPVTRTVADALATRLLAALQARSKATLFFANTNFVVQCRAQLPRMQEQGVIIVNDGIGIDIAAVLSGNGRFPDNLNGTDFTPFLCRSAGRPLRLFLLGAKEEVVQQAATHARTALGQQVAGTCNGYEEMRATDDLIARINEARPDVLLVALGNPIQEEWILTHRDALEVPVVMGVGALFDFWAGAKSRAPQLVRSLRLEWFYRLCLEPRRLARRYTVDIVRFLAHCHRYRLPAAPTKGKS